MIYDFLFFQLSQDSKAIPLGVNESSLPTQNVPFAMEFPVSRPKILAYIQIAL